MEETQTIQELSPGLVLVAALEEVGVRDGVIQVRTQDVGTHTLGRLIGHLDSYIRTYVHTGDRSMDRMIAP